MIATAPGHFAPSPENAEPARRPLEGELVSGLAGFLALESDWRALVELTETQNPFLAWEWASTWVRHFSADRVRTVVVRSGGRVVAVAPFHLNRYWIGPGLRTSALQLFGPREIQHLFEIREVPVAPGCDRVEVFETVIGRLLEHPGWDWVELAGQGPSVDAWRHALSSVGGAGSVREEAEIMIPMLRLQRSWEEQKRLLKRNVKESIRHSYNSLARDGIAHEFSIHSDPAEIATEARLLFDLHHRRSLVAGRRWHRDHFTEAATRGFLVDAFERLAAAGRLSFARVTIEGAVVASRACLEANGALYLYYSGFDPAWWRYGVPTLLVTEALRDAIARSLGAVNLSPGLDQSKVRWDPVRIPMRNFVLTRRNPLSQARGRLLHLRKAARQPLHRTLDPVLSAGSRPAVRLRALLGRGASAIDVVTPGEER
ncbi:MAG: GNAT family N-acetyltransferase [Candidatus Dormibacteraceae bacterium]